MEAYGKVDLAHDMDFGSYTLFQLRQLLAGQTISTLYMASAPQTVTSAFFDNVVGCSVAGTTITKTGVAVSWDSGASSSQRILANGGVTATIGNSAQALIFGLSSKDTNAVWDTVEYGAHARLDGQLWVYESGVQRPVANSTFVGGDAIEVKRIGNTIYYLKNAAPWYTSLVTTTAPLMFDSSFFTQGQYLSNVTLTGATPQAGRVSAAPGLTQPGYNLAQATAAKRPLLVLAPTPYWEFDGARVLMGATVPVAASCSVFAIGAVGTSPGVGSSQFMVQNGTWVTNGFRLRYINTPPLNVVFDVYTPWAAVSSASISAKEHIDAKWDGANIASRINSGAWAASVAGAMTTASGGALYVGGADGTPAFGHKGPLYLLGMTSPMLTTAQYNTLSNILMPMYGVL